jgi:hypothetical protein
METKGKPKPLSREERDNKRIKVDIVALQDHISVLQDNIIQLGKQNEFKNLKK